jgi:NADH/NAD ratio-sensing transcriptional regulator Rex
MSNPVGVGRKLGKAVGHFDGDIEGKVAEGELVGSFDSDGEIVGRKVGKLEDGLGVGNELGSSVEGV